MFPPVVVSSCMRTRTRLNNHRRTRLVATENPCERGQSGLGCEADDQLLDLLVAHYLTTTYYCCSTAYHVQNCSQKTHKTTTIVTKCHQERAAIDTNMYLVNIFVPCFGLIPTHESLAVIISVFDC